MKVDDIKDILRLRGLRVSEKKSELVARVLLLKNNKQLMEEADFPG